MGYSPFRIPSPELQSLFEVTKALLVLPSRPSSSCTQRLPWQLRPVLSSCNLDELGSKV